MRALRLLPLIALLLPAAAAALAPMSVSEILSRGSSGVGYSYWWGGGAWDPGQNDWLGSCSGSCGACSHGPSRARNGRRERGPEFGADCSGFVAKAWRVPDSNDSFTRNSHPYSTSDFNVDHRGMWTSVSDADTRAGDARVRRSGGSGHIYLVSSVSGRGGLNTMEAVGCRPGIVRQTRNTADAGYKTIRRAGESANQPPNTPEKPRGRDRVAANTALRLCTRATDPDGDKVRYFLVGSKASDRTEAARTQTDWVRSGTELCASITFTQPGTYVVEARAQDEEQAFSARRSEPLTVIVDGLPRSNRYVVTMAHQDIRARPGSNRWLDLDVYFDAPGGPLGRAGTIGRDRSVATLMESATEWPFVQWSRADCAGCTEEARILRNQPGDYTMWMYDYENASRATNAMGKAKARIVVSALNDDNTKRVLHVYDAPAGTYNKWIVAKLTFDQSTRLVRVTPIGRTGSIDLY